jgi:hypothetical protein
MEEEEQTMGISESEYRAMLANNDQLSVKDDGTPRQGKAKTPLVACSHFSGPVIVPTEHEEQVALFQWAAANEEEHEELKLLFAVPNGGYRPMTTAAMLREEGVKAGVPDCCLPVARGRFYSLWLELKRADRSNHPTPAQAEWIECLRSYGHMAVVCYGAQEAIKVITDYLTKI